MCPPGVAASEESIAGGGTDGVGAVGVGEREAFLGESVEVWGLKFGVWIEAGGIAESLVIGINDDDVWLFLCGKRGGEKERERCFEEGIHRRRKCLRSDREGWVN